MASTYSEWADNVRSLTQDLIDVVRSDLRVPEAYIADAQANLDEDGPGSALPYACHLVAKFHVAVPDRIIRAYESAIRDEEAMVGAVDAEFRADYETLVTERKVAADHPREGEATPGGLGECRIAADHPREGEATPSIFDPEYPG